MSNDYNWEKAKELFEKAVEIDPNNATIRFQYANHADLHEDVNIYIIQVNKGKDLDPLSALAGHGFFMSLIKNNKIEEAEQYYSKYDWLFTKPGEQLEKESLIIAYKNKDWTAAFTFLETELIMNPNNAILNRKVGEAYDGIFLDDKNYLKFTKKAYELDSTDLDNGDQYYYALLKNEIFIDAKKLMESENFKSLYSKEEYSLYLFWYYYEQENYKKAQDLLNDSLIYDKFIYELYLHARLGNRNLVDTDVVNPYSDSDYMKARIFAILKEKDSMFYYLNFIAYNSQRQPFRSQRDGFMGRINSLKEFDPYRKEERFKELLRKYYLPITHWNE